MSLPAKISAMVKRDSADALVRVMSAIAAAEATHARLSEQRRARLEAGDVAGARRLDSDIAAIDGDLAALRDRATILERQVEEARAEQAERDYQAVVDALEAPVARRIKSAARVARAFKEFVAAVREYGTSNRGVQEAWQRCVSWPDRGFGSGYSVSSRVAVKFSDALFYDTISRLTRRPLGSDEALSRLLKVDLDDFAVVDAELARGVIEEARHAHDPRPEPESEESGETEQTDQTEQTEDNSEAA